MVSFGIGVVAVTPALALVYFLIKRELPVFHLRVALVPGTGPLSFAHSTTGADTNSPPLFQVCWPALCGTLETTAGTDDNDQSLVIVIISVDETRAVGKLTNRLIPCPAFTPPCTWA